MAAAVELGRGHCEVGKRFTVRKITRRMVLAAALAIAALGHGVATAALPGPPPKPPRAPGSIGLPAAPPPTAHQAVLDAYERIGIREAQARRFLDLQAKAGDLTAKLVSRLPGLSQVYFDNDEGRYVVTIGPKGSEQRAQTILADLGLAGSDVQRAALDREELAELVDAVRTRLKSVRPQYFTISLVRGGVELTVAAGASAAERALIEDAGKRPGVLGVRRVAKKELTAPPQACNGSTPNGRVCNELVGGVRYLPTGCTLGWRSGSYDGAHPNQFLTAGHCVTPGGAAWTGCQVSGGCYHAGGEIGVVYGPGDSGLLAVHNLGWVQQAGYIDWRNGSRQPITYYAGWYGLAMNEPICHAGSTTGYWCGFFDGYADVLTDGTPLYPSGVWLRGMIRTRGACTQGGDSGGPVFMGDMRGAVGVHSAGDPLGRACGDPARVAYHEPIRRAIADMGVWPYGG